jgi:hypothetical protein
MTTPVASPGVRLARTACSWLAGMGAELLLPLVLAAIAAAVVGAFFLV